MEAAVAAVEAAFAAHGRGEAAMPPKVYPGLPAHDGDLRAMPAYADGAAGVKWVNSHPKNPARFGLPSVMGLHPERSGHSGAPRRDRRRRARQAGARSGHPMQDVALARVIYAAARSKGVGMAFDFFG
ncbi:hypothetical protein [Sorangium cellulosum]|nr:hypothetical protein [Sorangium cellulosum]